MLGLVQVCGKAGFEVKVIEPGLLAYLRAIFSRKIAGTGQGNSLVAILQETDSTPSTSSGRASSPQAVLNLCVVKNGSIDFLRTKEKDGSVELNRWLADELSEVVRFYDIEVPENIGKWDITIFVDGSHPLKGLGECLKAAITAGNLQVRTNEDVCIDTDVDCSKAQSDDNPSPVAVGLAARLLKPEYGELRINLVPPKVIKAREAKLDAVIAANVIAVILLLMVLSIAGFTFMIKKVTRSSLANTQFIAKQDTELMLQQHQNLDGRLNVLSNRLERLSQISASHNDVNLVDMLDDIRKSTPGSVMISSIYCQDGSRVFVDGLAMSNEAVNLFVDLLEKSQLISSVALLEARKQDGQKNLITYQISCKLVKRSPGSPG
jgi:Tfp pilus assembly protein PilN